MKVIINALGIWDLTDPNEIKKAIDNIKIDDDDEIIVDITGCLIYYGTSDFIDKLLEKIHNTKQIKKIIFICYRFLSDDSLYEYLFKRSIININNNENDKKQNFKEKVTQKIKEKYNIDFSAEMSDE